MSRLPDEKLKALYQEIADMTRPRCGQCRVPWQCCQTEHCEMVKHIAQESYGMELEPVDPEARLPYLNPDGTCSVEPWLRPLCAVHVCEGQLYRDMAFSERYFQLRGDIDEMSFEQGLMGE